MGHPESADAGFLQALVNALPGSAFVVDAVGDVLFATESAAALVGRRPEQLVGESVLTFVSQDTAWAYAAAVALTTDYPDTVMGPMRVSFVDANGSLQAADLWAANHLDDPTIRGIVCLVSEETAMVGLTEAAAALGAGARLEEVAVRVVTALRGHPVVADACVLVPAERRYPDERTYRVLAAADVAEALMGPLESGPWDAAVRHRIRQLHGQITDLPGPVERLAAGAGYSAVWSEPLLGPEGDAWGALVLWRRRPGNPSPNQLRSVGQAASLLDLSRRLDAADPDQSPSATAVTGVGSEVASPQD